MSLTLVSNVNSNPKAVATYIKLWPKYHKTFDETSLDMKKLI